MSSRLFVPFAATDLDTLDALLARRDRPWEDRLRRALVRAERRSTAAAPETGGLRFFLDAHGRPSVNFARSPDEPLPGDDREAETPERDADVVRGPAGAWTSWTELRLSPGAARALEAELRAVWDRYRGQTGEGRFLLRLALTPEEA